MYIEAVKIIRSINYSAQQTFNICIGLLGDHRQGRNSQWKIDRYDSVVKGPQCYQDDQKNWWRSDTCFDGIVVPQTAARSSTRYSLYHITGVN